MTRADARKLVAVLRTAWPSPAWDGPTIALYTAELENLDDVAAAADTIRGLVRSNRWRPTIAELLADYREEARRRREERAQARGLEAPEPTPEERRENLRQVRELMARIGEAE